MSTKMLEHQVAELQKRIANLERGFNGKSGAGWKQIVGTSKGFRLDQEAARLGAPWRVKANKRK